MATPKRENSFAEEAPALSQPANGAGQQAANKIFDKTYNSNGVTTGSRQNWVTGTFTDRDSAENAYNSMLSRGYDEKDINLMMSDETRRQYFADENPADSQLGSKAMEGAGVGGAIGGTA